MRRWLHSSHLQMLVKNELRERKLTGIGRCKLGQCLVQRPVQLVQIAMIERRKQMVQNVIAELGEHGEAISLFDAGPIDHRVHLEQAPVEVISVKNTIVTWI